MARKRKMPTVTPRKMQQLKRRAIRTQTPIVLYSKGKQTGVKRYDKPTDRKIKGALPPGKRIAKSGNVYYEYRVNRSDKRGKRT